jgi:hypothetical protein
VCTCDERENVNKNHKRRSIVPQSTGRDRKDEFAALQKENERLQHVITTAVEQIDAGELGYALRILKGA